MKRRPLARFILPVLLLSSPLAMLLAVTVWGMVLPGSGRFHAGASLGYGGHFFLDAPAKIVDESKGAGKEQTVVGSKIRFWVDAEQVEVLDASITTPTSGAGDLKKALGGGL